MSALREAIDEQARVELQRAVRALLRRPLLTVWLHEEELGLVRRHARELQAFFAEHVGWALSVDRETARLRKVPPTRTDGSRPARGRPQDPPFSRRRYVLLCLALAALERTDRQTTLRRVAEAVAAMVAEDDALAAAGVEFSLEGREQRRDLVAIVRWLLDHGVLARVEGDEESFVADQGDALYRSPGARAAARRAVPTLHGRGVEPRRACGGGHRGATARVRRGSPARAALRVDAAAAG